MNAKTAIKLGIDMGHLITTSYLGDLTDEEMMHRPADGCNHIKWQVGHLLISEHNMIEGAAPGTMPALPEGFEDRYTKETATSDNADDFDSKETLMKVVEEQRAGTLKALEALDDEAFSKETGIDYAPTVGDLFSMQGSHWIMHAGQWAVIRRQLGRPPLF